MASLPYPGPASSLASARHGYNTRYWSHTYRNWCIVYRVLYGSICTAGTVPDVSILNRRASSPMWNDLYSMKRIRVMRASFSFHSSLTEGEIFRYPLRCTAPSSPVCSFMVNLAASMVTDTCWNAPFGYQVWLTCPMPLMALLLKPYIAAAAKRNGLGGRVWLCSSRPAMKPSYALDPGIGE